MKKSTEKIDHEITKEAIECYENGSLLAMEKKGNVYFAEVLIDDEVFHPIIEFDDDGLSRSIKKSKVVFHPIIEFDDDGEVTKLLCHCDNDTSSPCIHLCVMLVGITNGDFTIKEEHELDDDYKKLIEESSLEDLKKLILDYAANSRFFTHVSSAYLECEDEDKIELMELVNGLYSTMDEMMDLDEFDNYDIEEDFSEDDELDEEEFDDPFIDIITKPLKS